MELVSWFNELEDQNLVNIAGGKGASLSRMSHQDLPVPDGFIIHADMYKYFIEFNRLEQPIKDLLEQIDWDNDCANLAPISNQIKELISDASVPAELKESLKKYYENMGDNVPVAIRSSSTVEDLDDASCAGQQDTYLYVIGLENIIKDVKNCWASLFNDCAIFYRHQKGFSCDVSIAVVVQRMVNSEKAGVVFSVNPITGAEDEVCIEASWGLGESVVSGIVTPDNYWIKKGSYEIISEYISEKEVMVIRLCEEGGVKEVPVPPELMDEPTLSQDELKALVDIAIKVEDFYGHPQDLEWAFENNKLYLLQSRPITTLN